MAAEGKNIVRVVVDMYGGTISQIYHDRADLELDVVFTEGAKYAEGDEVIIRDADNEWFIYTRGTGTADLGAVEAVFAHVPAFEQRGHWDEDPDHPVEDWQNEVANGDTRLGYAEWVKAKKEAAE